MSVIRSAALTNSPPDFFQGVDDLNLPIIGCTLVNAIAASNSNSPSSTEAEDPLFPAANLLTPSTHLRWASLDTGNDIFLDATGFEDDVNYVAFAAHNFAGQTITIYGRTSGSPADLFQIFEATFIDNNEPLVMQFQQSDYVQIRVQISGGGIRTAAIMYVGLLLTMERGIKVEPDHASIWQAQKTDVVSGYSESGNFLGRLVRNQIFETKYEFSNVSDEFFGNDDGLPLWVFLKFIAPNRPFFICFAPKDYGNAIGFVWLIDDPVPLQSPITKRWSFALEVRGYAGGS